MVISLIGYRATGKTTVAMLLAERLGWTGVDTDAEVQRVTGVSISSLFENYGEERFRDYESQVVRDLTRRHKLVLSLGGGAILRDENRKAISVAGPVVWLAATPATIQRRLADDGATATQRPSLTGRSTIDEVQEVLQARQPIYAQCADLTIQTDDLSPKYVVDAILADLDLVTETQLP